MAADPPKKVKGYVREAKRMTKIDPNVAYYVELFAATEAMKIDPQTPEVKTFVMATLTRLESQKGQVEQVEKVEVMESLKGIADNAFNHADQVDRAGNASQKTALAFRTASTLYSVYLSNNPDPEMAERKKYSLFKATDIIRCIKNGVKPTPGPPNQPEEEPEPVTEPAGNTNDFGLPSVPVSSNQNDFGLPSVNNNNNNDFGLPSVPGMPSTTNNNNDLGLPTVPASSNDFGLPTVPASNNDFGLPTVNVGGAGNQNFTQPSYPSSGNTGYPSVSSQQPSQPSNQPRRPQKPKPKPAKKTNIRAATGRPTDFQDRVAACSRAEGLMKHAFGAMRFNDVEAAAVKLEEVLEVLRPWRN